MEPVERRRGAAARGFGWGGGVSWGLGGAWGSPGAGGTQGSSEKSHNFRRQAGWISGRSCGVNSQNIIIVVVGEFPKRNRERAGGGGVGREWNGIGGQQRKTFEDLGTGEDFVGELGFSGVRAGDTIRGTASSFAAGSQMFLIEYWQTPLL